LVAILCKRGGGVRNAGEEMQKSEKGSEMKDVEKPVLFRNFVFLWRYSSNSGLGLPP
jgi:hypothetical protein